MKFSHISQNSAQVTHIEENKKSMKMIGPWRGWSVSEPPKGAYHIVWLSVSGMAARIIKIAEALVGLDTVAATSVFITNHYL